VTRGLAARAGLVLLLWLLGGRVGLLVGLAITLADLLWRPSPALLLRASLVGFCLLPLAVVIRGLPRPSTVTPLFAGGNLVAHYLAFTALALLVLGVLRDVRPAPVPGGPGNGPPPDGYELPAPLPSLPSQEAPDDAGAGGNGAREPQPLPAPAHPSATHPPLWGPGRRRAGGAATPGGTAAETAQPPAPEPGGPSGDEAGGAQPDQDEEDRPGRPGRRHPPELRIAGGPSGTPSDRDQDPPPSEGEQGSDR
jgi:hypothetical protein